MSPTDQAPYAACSNHDCRYFDPLAKHPEQLCKYHRAIWNKQAPAALQVSESGELGAEADTETDTDTETVICCEVSCSRFDPQAEKLGQLCPRHAAMQLRLQRMQLQQKELQAQLRAMSPNVREPVSANSEELVLTHNGIEQPHVVHQTGAKRSADADEVRYDLIPQRMLARVARVMCTGGKKYGAHNWEQGFAWSGVMNHLLRHAQLWLIGDTSEDHLAHMACNLGFLMEFEETHPGLNDIPSRGGGKTP